MKVLLINHNCGIGSVGKICCDIAEEYEKDGNIVKIAYGRDSFVPEIYKKYAVRIGTPIGVRMHALRTRLVDEHGLGSQIATKKFLQWAEKFDPDLLWLHCIHGYYINYELLFAWIKTRPTMTVKWTMHDCWAFTGHCSHFTVAGCYKWKKHCKNCCQSKDYPGSIFKDNCSDNFIRKKRAFTGVNNMFIITPSEWLADYVKQSFFKDYTIEIQHNKVNKSIFKPTKSDFREKYNINNRRMILGVANVWNERKGLGDFLKLAKMLDERYIIVLVGVKSKYIRKFPSNILGIEQIKNPKKLAAIYTTADLFINPSMEETFGMTTVEALACGTDAVVMAGTACEEIAKEYGGIVVPPGDINKLYNIIVNYPYKKVGEFK